MGKAKENGKYNFIKKSKDLYGELFDHSDIEYQGSFIPIQTRCTIHGLFTMTPHNHIRGTSGCRGCKIDSLKEKAKKAHNGLYTYNNLEFANDVKNFMREKVNVTCSYHGDFSVSLDNHVKKKSGCPVCKGLNTATSKSSNTDSFIKKAIKKHNKFYDYSKTDYKRALEKVVITCPLHNDFLQTPNSHLSGNGCPECANESLRHTNETFIQKAKNKHKNFYKYSKTEYKGGHLKVIITCPEHGDFHQSPHNHLYGMGCVACMRKWRENHKWGEIYAIIDNKEKIRYIGQTVQGINKRKKQHLAKPSVKMQAWLDSIDYIPQTIILHTDVPIENLDALEQKTIVEYSVVHDVLNIQHIPINQTKEDHK